MDPAHLLRGARQIARLSQRGLAARSGVTAASIAGIESGARQPSWGTLARLLEACGVDLALATPVPELTGDEQRFLGLSTSERLYWSLGGRHNPATASRPDEPWGQLRALVRVAQVSLLPATAVSVWLPRPVERPAVRVHGRRFPQPLPSTPALDVVEHESPLPESAIPVGLAEFRDTWVPTPLALSLEPGLSDDAGRLRAVDRYLQEHAPRDLAARRRPAHRVSRPDDEAWRIRLDRAYGPLRELPTTLDRREWRAGGVVSLSQWLARHGYPDPRHPLPQESDEDDDLTLAELFALRDELRDSGERREDDGAA